MVAPMVPIGLMLGKADAAFKFVGGSSIVFNVIRSRIFGKVLRTIEYPDGDLHSIKIYRMTRYRLQSLIADTQPPPFPTAFLQPEDIKQIAVFTSPHFTEQLNADADISALPDNAWLFWSKDSYDENPIPMRGVKLDGSHIKKNKSERVEESKSDRELQDEAISIAGRIRKTQQYSRWQYDRLIDLAIDRDSGLMAIARNFSTSDDEFRIHSQRLLRRRDPRTILLAEDGMDKAGMSDATDSDLEDESGRRNIEPQVELSSRES